MSVAPLRAFWPSPALLQKGSRHRRSFCFRSILLDEQLQDTTRPCFFTLLRSVFFVLYLHLVSATVP